MQKRTTAAYSSQNGNSERLPEASRGWNNTTPHAKTTIDPNHNNSTYRCLNYPEPVASSSPVTSPQTLPRHTVQNFQSKYTPNQSRKSNYQDTRGALVSVTVSGKSFDDADEDPWKQHQVNGDHAGARPKTYHITKDLRALTLPADGGKSITQRDFTYGHENDHRVSYPEEYLQHIPPAERNRILAEGVPIVNGSRPQGKHLRTKSNDPSLSRSTSIPPKKPPRLNQRSSSVPRQRTSTVQRTSLPQSDSSSSDDHYRHVFVRDNHPYKTEVYVESRRLPRRGETHIPVQQTIRSHTHEGYYSDPAYATAARTSEVTFQCPPHQDFSDYEGHEYSVPLTNAHVELIHCSPSTNRRSFTYQETGDFPRGYPAKTFTPQNNNQPGSDPVYAVPCKIRDQSQLPSAKATISSHNIKVIVTPPHSPPDSESGTPIRELIPTIPCNKTTIQQNKTDSQPHMDIQQTAIPKGDKYSEQFDRLLTDKASSPDGVDSDPFSSCFEEDLNNLDTEGSQKSEFDCDSDIDAQLESLAKTSMTNECAKQYYHLSHDIDVSDGSNISRTSSANATNQNGVSNGDVNNRSSIGSLPPPPSPGNMTSFLLGEEVVQLEQIQVEEAVDKWPSPPAEVQAGGDEVWPSPPHDLPNNGEMDDVFDQPGDSPYENVDFDEIRERQGLNNTPKVEPAPTKSILKNADNSQGVTVNTTESKPNYENCELNSPIPLDEELENKDSKKDEKSHYVWGSIKDIALAQSSKTLPNVKSHSDSQSILRSQSTVARTKKHHYENVDFEPAIQRRHSEYVTMTGDSYENVTLKDSMSQKGMPRPKSFNFLDSSGSSTENGSRSSESGILNLRSNSSGSQSSPNFELPDINEGANDSDNSGSDGSYFSDSEFDDEDVYNLGDDGMSMLTDFTSSSDGSEVTGTITRSKTDPLYDIALELLMTEKAYVDRLHFICRIVLLNLKILHKVQDVHCLSPSAWKDIFSNVECIFTLHATNILPRLEDRLKNWKTEGQLGDILLDIIPLLGLYKEYMENFNRSMLAINTWMQKNPLFAALIEEVEKTPESRRLSVKQHLLEIVHRVPKYQAIIKDYLRYLLPETKERDNMEEALTEIDQLTSELTRCMGKDDRMKKLKDVQQKIDSNFTVSSPTRELVKEGKLKTIAPKNGKKFERYIFLLTDIILLCTTAGFGSKHKVKFILDIDGMQIHDGDNLGVQHTFYVQSKRKAIEFVASSFEDKQTWVHAIQKVVDSFTTWKLSTQPRQIKPKILPDDDLGEKAPPWTEESSVTKCSVCTSPQKKRTHCRACGQMACPKCLTQKLQLGYDNGRWNKVCDECYIIIKTRDMKSTADKWNMSPVAAKDPAKVAGYLQLSVDRGKSWCKRWVTVHHDGTLYAFKTHKDTKFHSSLPLRRFMVAECGKADEVKKPAAFKLYNIRKVYYFQCDRTEAAQGWIQQIADFTDSSV